MSQRAATTPTKAVKTTTSTKSLAKSQSQFAWLLLAPTIIVVILVGIYPLIQTFYISLTDLDLRRNTFETAQFIGFDNYVRLFQDIRFFNSIGNTVFFTVITVVIEFLLGLVIALVINSQFKGRGMMRAAMLIPWAIPTVVSAQMWSWMYNQPLGVLYVAINNILPAGENFVFIGRDTTVALISIAAVDIWKTTPFVALLLLAGLQVIPGDVYEAADVDGASPWQQLTGITLPLLMPAILVALIFRTLDALRVFDVFFVMFGQRRDTETMAIYAQQELVNNSALGYGSAISMGIFLIIAIFVVLYVTFLRVEEA